MAFGRKGKDVSTPSFSPADRGNKKEKRELVQVNAQDEVARLDEEFIATMKQVESVFHSLDRHLRIRCEHWAKKLCQVYANEIFQKNRNSYADLLLYCILNDHWVEPFDKKPDGGPLPQLPKHQAYMARQSKLEKATSTITTNRGPGVSLLDGKNDERQGRMSTISDAEHHRKSVMVDQQQQKMLQTRVTQLELETKRLRKQLKAATERAFRAERLLRLADEKAENATREAATAADEAQTVVARKSADAAKAAAKSLGLDAESARALDQGEGGGGEQEERLRALLEPNAGSAVSLLAGMDNVNISDDDTDIVPLPQGHPGPPPNIRSPEGFLRYLDDFQAYTQSLIDRSQQKDGATKS